ncbi:ferredoxin [archaeon SCG-AAA382B04]|nr:ferredoxin [archaeon SCG-AAA382B04]
MKKPVVDQEVCEGHAICVGMVPEVFEMGDDGKSHVKDPEGAEEPDIQKAIDNCPVDAIEWE